MRLFSRSTYALSYIFSEHLESERIVNEDDFLSFAKYLDKKYETTHIDGIICVGPEAYRFMGTYKDIYFEDIPVIHMGVDAEVLSEISNTTILGIYQEIPFESLFIEASALNPDLKKN